MKEYNVKFCDIIQKKKNEDKYEEEKIKMSQDNLLKQKKQ